MEKRYFLLQYHKLDGSVDLQDKFYITTNYKKYVVDDFLVPAVVNDENNNPIIYIIPHDIYEPKIPKILLDQLIDDEVEIELENVEIIYK
jgi:hypothetical protein